MIRRIGEEVDQTEKVFEDHSFTSSISVLLSIRFDSNSRCHEHDILDVMDMIFSKSWT